MNSVEDSIAQSIVYLENAIDVWNELKEHFSHGDHIRISELQVEIYTLKQGNKTVSEFFTALKILWEELESYLSAPVCNCPRKCVCVTGVSNAKHQHDLIRTIRFLTGLNDTFDMVRSQILLMEPLPPINKVFSMVMQHERQFASSQSVLELDEGKALVNASDARRSYGAGRGKAGSNNKNNKKSNRYCTFCGKDNHIVDNCYRKHGFPPNYGRNASVNNTAAEEQDNDDAKSYKGTGNDSYSFTKDQYERLINLLQASSIGAGSSSTAQVNAVQHHHSGIAYSLSNSTYGSWIIDSGASDHICSNLALFDKHHAIAPIQVKMANGTISYAKIAGTVKLFDDFYVHNVLLVPEFSLNLISVPKLTQSSSCTVVFNGVNCFIQERTSLRMIGSGELIEGLYYLTKKNK
jgi:hypothetical protein